MQPGFRFYPTEEELVSFYLHNELEEKRSDIHRVIPLLNVFQLEPWHLPKHCGELCHGDREQWFFFVPRQEREVRGGRPSRTTADGYWKATGSPSYVYSSGNKVIGVKKSMVFYKGKAPNGRKTEWKMNEYRAIEEDLTTSVRRLRNEVSLCRIYVVSGSVRAFDRRPTHVITGAPSSSGSKVKEKDRMCTVSTNEIATKSCSSEINKSDDNSMEMMSGLENLMEWDNI